MIDWSRFNRHEGRRTADFMMEKALSLWTREYNGLVKIGRLLEIMKVVLFEGLKIATILLLMIAFMAPFLNLQAAPATCVFISSSGTAWVMRRDSSVKATLKVGDIIYEGDQVTVLSGNSIEVAFDKEAKNIAHIIGEATFQIKGSNPTYIELTSGKLFALLKNRDPQSTFSVSTPTAIATVRGTEYQVKVEKGESQVLVYQGKVELEGKDKAGKPSGKSVMVKAGQKTKVQSLGKAPEAPKAMTEKEKSEIVTIHTKVDATKKAMNAQVNLGKIFDKSAQGGPDRVISDKPQEEDKTFEGTVKSKDKGAVVF